MTSETKSNPPKLLKFSRTAEITLHLIEPEDPLLSKDYITLMITHKKGVGEITMPLSQAEDLRRYIAQAKTHEIALASFFTKYGAIYRNSLDLAALYILYPSFKKAFKPPAPQLIPKRLTAKKKAAALADTFAKDPGAGVPPEAIPLAVLDQAFAFGTQDFHGTPSQSQSQETPPMETSPDLDTLNRSRSNVGDSKSAALSRSSSSGKKPMTRSQSRPLTATSAERRPAESNDEEMETAATRSAKPAAASSSRLGAAAASSAASKPSAPLGGTGFFSRAAGAGSGAGSKASAQPSPHTTPAAFFGSDEEPAAKRQKTERGKSAAAGAGSSSNTTQPASGIAPSSGEGRKRKR